MMGEQFGLIRALPCFGIHNIDNISVVGLVSPSNGHWNNRPSNDGLGSILDIRWLAAYSVLPTGRSRPILLKKSRSPGDASE